MPARIVWRTELGQQLPGEWEPRRRAARPRDADTPPALQRERPGAKFSPILGIARRLNTACAMYCRLIVISPKTTPGASSATTAGAAGVSSRSRYPHAVPPACTRYPDEQFKPALPPTSDGRPVEIADFSLDWFSLAGRNALVTGGNGYVATQLIAALLRGGAAVRTTVRSVDREDAVRTAVRRGGADDAGLDSPRSGQAPHCMRRGSRAIHSDRASRAGRPRPPGCCHADRRGRARDHTGLATPPMSPA